MRVCGEFVGKIKQIPPMYSALKVGGKKLCDLARQGEVIERAAREIEIFSLECSPSENGSDYVMDVKCSSGTYIRTLCADIGARLGCGGAMATLERKNAGGFDIKNSVTVEEIESMDEEGRASLLLPIESLFDDIETVKLAAFYEKLSRNGCEIYQKKIKMLKN
jgi:tRNA pseudouridine55 synthase